MKLFLKIGVSLLVVILLVGGGYVGYVYLQYYRIKDNTPTQVINNPSQVITQNQTHTALTYNIGFGAYNQPFSFFMDSGQMKDGTKVNGTYAKAFDKQVVLDNTNGVIEVLKKYDPDFALIQEIDQDGDRSRHVNQTQMLLDEYSNQGYSFTSNFHTAYLMYPFNDPIGKSDSGLARFSRYQVVDSVRRSYPVDNSFNKFFDLDRCFNVDTIPVDNGKNLVMINSHMSAYDEGGKIRAQQLAFLNKVVKEHIDRGDYVIVGGDFNHTLATPDDAFKTDQVIPNWIAKLENKDLTPGLRIVTNDLSTPSVRSTDMPYTKGINYTTVVDGFLVSDNVEASAHVIDTDFKYSDHNPVLLEFKLK